MMKTIQYPWLLRAILGVMLWTQATCRQTPQEGGIVERKPPGDPFFAQRQSMVEDQIKSRGIVDGRVLEAMRTVRREKFVPEAFVDRAYSDEPLPIEEEQTISQPYIVAFMTEALKLEGNEKVLEIGTGSGYQAAVLAEVAGDVYTIEIIGPLASRARETLVGEGYGRVHCRCGDGYDGWPEEAPFDAVIVTAAPPHVPKKLLDQLKEGGRLVVPVGTWFQELMRYTKRKGRILEERLIPVRFVPMTGKIQKE